MALLTLHDIGKIYVSEGAISVGLRGVNLSFDRGEFVAVTGKSGSGKSTLLNVISGMDSYEEGELFINGQATSHYLQPDWEAYRQEYISFIFQDYNIIESFTVLQNVELALMHIENKKERRSRALELLNRVGLSSHIHQKGSKLSGGQKQRTVIARALAKDSPIILADEPTGNLDSVTSAEIMALLHEVSKDKLLIVVTHNFEQVEAYATRHIRIFDGTIESDHLIKFTQKPAATASKPASVKKQPAKTQCKNGLILGKTVFIAKPKLSVFLCLLMILGTLGIFMVTSLCGSLKGLWEPYTMFTHIDGRLVLTTQSGEVLAEEQIQKLAAQTGAKDYLRCDLLLDLGQERYARIPTNGIKGYEHIQHESIFFHCIYGEDYGTDIVGRYPQAVNEVFLYLPISYQPLFGKDTLQTDIIEFSNVAYRITGVAYYYDNNLTPKCLFTRAGFETATALYYLFENAVPNMELSVIGENGEKALKETLDTIAVSFDMDSDKIYVHSSEYAGFRQEVQNSGTAYKTDLSFFAVYHNYNYYFSNSVKDFRFSRSFTEADMTVQHPKLDSPEQFLGFAYVVFSDELIHEMAYEVLNNSYAQVSLFYDSDAEAHKAAQILQDAGYIAVPSNTTYEPDPITAIGNTLSGLLLLVVWSLSIVFLAFFLNLCSSRTLGAFKEDMAIMRSMGIEAKVIRIAIYVRMLVALIPAFILMAVTAFFIFTVPKFNAFFVYLYGWQYALIVLGMLLLTIRITHKQIHKLFDESVKKSLKGGAAE